MGDGLSQVYAELLEGTYDCLDRIVLNGYFRFAQSPAGFRVWWRQLYGNDDDLDNAHLMRMAGRFRRRYVLGLSPTTFRSKCAKPVSKSSK